ncbi:S-layer homology domain-containing protein [Alkalihalobacillus sp. MEB130]|uniref:C40 family peptidase n=1 Tax=Alkalihalobacillus sp. MEB130 TaxID=2976704 RepID=UPI0028DF85D9|nr:S-layer homology domain-containing protein [Alkalihalobacillus sp. MEB130]MDT8858827.1 S-layer homology domain-containing protein [Alkalihalobacillus sp. MEB130]
MFRRFMSTLLAIILLVTLYPSTQVSASSTASKVVAAAKAQIGTPYVWGGTTPRGFDCSGFMRYVYNQVGISLPRTTAEQYRVGNSVSKSNLQPGDLVFFETYQSGASHSGVYIGNNQFVHASSSNGVSTSSINDPHYWGPRYIGAKRVINEQPAKVQEVKPVSLLSGQYHDVPNSFWAYNEIKRLGESEIINGYNDYTFRPNNEITRSQVARLLARALNLKPTNYSGDFNDVNPNTSGYEEIQAVVDAGLFLGDSNGNFRPNDRFTRAHIAIVFDRAFNLPETVSAAGFTDVSSSSNAYDAIQRLAASGITTGHSDNTFRPNNSTTRAQLAVFLHRALYE